MLFRSSNKGTVQGTVSLDGQPVASGAVTFVQSESQMVREGAVITNGTFTATLAPGNYRVELNGQKVVGKRKQKGFDGKDEEVEITQELFPERYNVKSELTATVKPGPNPLKLVVGTEK